MNDFHQGKTKYNTQKVSLQDQNVMWQAIEKIWGFNIPRFICYLWKIFVMDNKSVTVDM